MRYFWGIFCLSISLYANIKYNFGFQYGVFSVKDYTFNVIIYSPQISTKELLVSMNFDFIYDTNGNFYYNKYSTIESVFSSIGKIKYTNNFIFLDIEKKVELNLTDGILLKRLYLNHLPPLYYYPSGMFFLNLNFLDLHILTDNILDLDILASYLKFRPFFFMDEEILKNFSITFDNAIDTDPENIKTIQIDNRAIEFNDNSSNFVFIYKIGISTTIYRNNFLNFSLNLDYASIYTKGIGFFGGVMGEVFNSFHVGVNYAFCSEKFVPHYFDVFYENEKRDKFYSLDNINSPYSYYSLVSGVKFFDKNLKFEFEIEKQDRNDKYPEFYFSIVFNREFFKIIDFRLSFHKADITRIEDLTLSSDFSRMYVMFNFYMSEFIIFGFEYKYLFHPVEIINYKNDIFMYMKAIF